MAPTSSSSNGGRARSTTAIRTPTSSGRWRPRALVDPLPTLRNLAAFVGLPVGAIGRHALVKWTSAGSDALLEVGPAWVRRLGEPVARAEAAGTDEARLAAYEELRGLLGWLAAGLDEGPFDSASG